MSKNLIVVYSYHHGNTAKVADTMASVLDADVKRPNEVKPEDISSYQLVGFGAGIDTGKHYAPMLDFAHSLLSSNGQRAFIFSTAGVTGKKKILKDHKALRDILLSKGFEIVDEFGCKGHDTVAFLKYFGGLNKGRPNEEDLEKAKDFAKRLDAISSEK